MGKRRRLRKSGDGELEVNMQDVASDEAILPSVVKLEVNMQDVASDEAILPSVAVSDVMILLPYVAGGDEGVVESHVGASDATIIQQNVASDEANSEQDVASDEEMGPEVESDKAALPLALLCPLNLARKDKEWTHVGSKWRCKVGNCTTAYCAKWLLTKHLKEVHGLVAEKSKPGRPSTAAGGPRQQDHAKMNARILGNAMAVQRRNDQKVASRARAKAQREWENLVAVAKQCPPFPKPGLVKLASEKLLKVLGLTAWGVSSVPRDAALRMEKDEDLQGII
ncbi:unnamed protein product [Sphagnum balticum]